MNYFESVNDHIEKLDGAYLARIAGTPASTGPSNKGFAISGEGE
jgi:bacterioferritin